MAKFEFETGPTCPACGSDNVECERAYRSPWMLITCHDCGETSEVDAELVDPAAERY